VRAAGIFVVARAYIGALLTQRRIRRNLFYTVPKITGIRLRLLESPAGGGVSEILCVTA
jgi:hypothetical protein